MLSSSVMILVENHRCPPVYQGTSIISRASIHLVSGSVLNNFTGLSLKGHCNHNPNKALGVSQEDLTLREPKVTQGQSENCSGRRDAPGLQQWGVKRGTGHWDCAVDNIHGSFVPTSSNMTSQDKEQMHVQWKQRAQVKRHQESEAEISRSKWKQILGFKHVLLRVQHTHAAQRARKKDVWRLGLNKLSKICPSTYQPPTYKNGATSTKGFFQQEHTFPFQYFGKSQVGQEGISPEMQGRLAWRSSQWFTCLLTINWCQEAANLLWWLIQQAL